MCNYSSSFHLTYFRMFLYRPIYYSIEEFYVYTHIMSIFDVRFCVGMFIQEFWPLLRLLILLTLIWWQVSNLSKISRIVLPWIQRTIDSYFGWNHWSIICLSKVSSWVSNLSKEWIWHAKSGISGPGVWSISPHLVGSDYFASWKCVIKKSNFFGFASFVKPPYSFQQSDKTGESLTSEISEICWPVNSR